MSYFLQSGDSFMPAPSRESLLDRLPVGNYTVEESLTGLFFQRAERFQSHPRLYGDVEKRAGRILHTFQDRPGNTGVLLAGEKGSGKSLLGRVVCSKAAEAGMPTIMVNRPYQGSQLGSLLTHLTAPAVVFLDEFEKVYAQSQLQETVLSLLDGTGSSHHLFLLTVNDSYRVDQHMKNRPGRLFYNLEFRGLEETFVREYCEDNLADKSQAEAVYRLTKLFDSFNFDMLKALVEEMNRYGETAQEAVSMLNITPAESQANYTITARDPQGKKRELISDSWWGNPLFLDEWDVTAEALEDEGEDEDITFTSDNLHGFSAEAGTFTFLVDGWTLTLTSQTRRSALRPHWSSF